MAGVRPSASGDFGHDPRLFGPVRLRGDDPGRRSGGLAAADRRDAGGTGRRAGQPQGLTQNAGDGMDGERSGTRYFLILSTQTCHGARMASPSPGAPHGPLGDQPAGPRGGRGVTRWTSCRLPAMARIRVTGVPGDDRDDRQPPYRNDAAIVFRRLIRSLPRRRACWASRPATRGCRR